jgi:FAD/FMN-containing dehydrogenase
MTFAPANQEFVERFGDQLPPDRFSRADARFLIEQRGLATGQPDSLVARPRSTAEVALIVRQANAANVAVIPYGGGTGLVGGQIRSAGPPSLILSCERMKKISKIKPETRVVTTQSGVVLSDLHAALGQQDMIFPLSLGAQGECQIGGNLATNAGGAQVLKYGNMRDLCLGIEAVLPTGEVFNGLSELRKDNTGYDLRHLLIGAEGTLGIITAATLRIFPKPVQQCTAILNIRDLGDALSILEQARIKLDDRVTAFELINLTGVDLVGKHLPDVRIPIAEKSEWMVLIEVVSLIEGDLDSAFNAFVEAEIESGRITNGTVAQSAKQRDEIWTFRETIPLGNRREGAIASHDISVPLDVVASFIESTSRHFHRQYDVRINCFGHVGDGNLHYNIFPGAGRVASDYRNVKAHISDYVYKAVLDTGGSISAEHGIGRFKKAQLAATADPTKLGVMAAVKKALDPNGIMNPGALIDVPS